jgi:hypothetical protein
VADIRAAAVVVVRVAGVVVLLAAAVAVPLAAVVVGPRFKDLRHSAALADHKRAAPAVARWPHDPTGLPAARWYLTANPAGATDREAEWRCGRVVGVFNPVRAPGLAAIGPAVDN